MREPSVALIGMLSGVSYSLSRGHSEFCFVFFFK